RRELATRTTRKGTEGVPLHFRGLGLDDQVPRESLSDNPTYPANRCSFSGCLEFAGDCEDLGKTVGESVQTAAGRAIGQVAAGRLRYVLSGQQGVDHTVQARAG